jgi:hypothetical protein
MLGKSKIRVGKFLPDIKNDSPQKKDEARFHEKKKFN